MTDPSPDPVSAADPVAPGDEPLIPRDERSLVMLCHLLSLAGYVVPFGNIIGPLVLWLVKKDESLHVDLAGRESLNFQITLTIIAVVAVILVLVGIGICIFVVLPIYHIVCVIVATIKANDGHHWRYPMTIRLL